MERWMTRCRPWCNRSAVQESIGESPAMMMLGRELTLPVDVLTEKPAEEGERGDYAENLRDRLYSAHERARDKLKLASEHQAKMYDRNTMLRCYKVGGGYMVWRGNVEFARSW